MPGRPTTVTLEDETQKDISFIMKHCPTPRSTSAVIRGVMSKYRKMLENQLKLAEEDRVLWLTSAEKKDHPLDARIEGQLDLRF